MLTEHAQDAAEVACCPAAVDGVGVVLFAQLATVIGNDAFMPLVVMLRQHSADAFRACGIGLHDERPVEPRRHHDWLGRARADAAWRPA